MADKPLKIVDGKKLKISHWDDEVNFDIEYEGVEDVNIYDITDGVEYEVLLQTKPNTNIFKYKLNKKEVVWYYQPALTQEEIDEGCVRPDNVVGSYAVYHATKKNNEYTTGKVCHVYRPKAIDANGDEVWCDFNNDAESKGKLEICLLYTSPSPRDRS